MHAKRHFKNFWDSLSQPRVFAFIVIGAAVVFLTFFTSNNALELAISGIASIFIGIGVNNFTSQQTQQDDEEAMKKRERLILQLLNMVHTRLVTHSQGLAEGKPPISPGEINEIIELIALLKQVLQDE